MLKLLFLLSTVGVLVMETLEHAQKRGAPIIAEYLGGAVTCDAYHMTDPRADGLGVATCIELAVKDAGIEKEAVRTSVSQNVPSNDIEAAIPLNAKVAWGCGLCLPATKGVGVELWISCHHCLSARQVAAFKVLESLQGSYCSLLLPAPTGELHQLPCHEYARGRRCGGQGH